MLAVIIPAHNEAEVIGPCLQAVMQAARNPMLGGEPASVVVVLDDCTDQTRSIAESFGVAQVASQRPERGHGTGGGSEPRAFS